MNFALMNCGTFHSITKEIDTEDNQGGTFGILVVVALQTCQATGLDAYLAAYSQTGGVDGDLILCIAYHTHEVFHLLIGDAGKVAPASIVLRGTIHQEVEDELGLTGYLVADAVSAPYEEITGAEDFFYFHTLAGAGAVAHLLLDGDVCCDGLSVLHHIFLLPEADEVAQPINSPLLGIGRDDGYKPVQFVIFMVHGNVKLEWKIRLRHRQVFTTYRGKSLQKRTLHDSL